MTIFEKIGRGEIPAEIIYEDEDFFRRARKAGFKLATTGRAYLHHFGSVTQKSVKAARGGAERDRLGNRDYFRRKHGLGWLRRRLEHQREKRQGRLARDSEQAQFGLTLNLRRLEGGWQYR